jgi:hypothetical protein
VATFTISINGYGGEVVLGKITKEAYEYWSKRDDDDEALNSHLFWDPYEEEDGNEITDDEDPRFLGQWWEIDDIEHTNGANVNECTVFVEDENGNEIYESDEIKLENTTYSDPEDQEAGYYFKGWSAEKGNFFHAEIETDVFDHNKLKFFATDIDGDTIIDHVEYDGEHLDNEGGDTRGKSQGWEFYEIF